MENSGIQPRLRARNEGRFAKEINLIPPQTEQTIINTLLALKADGITEGTLRHLSFQLKVIARNVDITNPEAVKLYIATAQNQTTGKPLQNEARNKLAYAYGKYCARGVKAHRRAKNRYMPQNSP